VTAVEAQRAMSNVGAAHVAMSSRRYPTDAGLSVRMALSLLGLAVVYAPFFFWLVGVFSTMLVLRVPAMAFLLAAVAVLAASALASSTLRADDLHQADPALAEMLDRLCGLTGVPVPRLAVKETVVATSFTLGWSPARSTIVVTRGLLDRLDAAEVETVLAHELAHIANYDAFVLSLISVPARMLHGVIRWIVSLPRRSLLTLPLFLYLIPVLFLAWIFDALATLHVMTISRYRELVADRGAALVTGRPDALMSALQKLSGPSPMIPREDLRATATVEPFLILPTDWEGRARGLDPFSLFPTHPPLSRRLEQLEEISRSLGKLAKPETVTAPRAERSPNPAAGLAFFLAVLTWPVSIGGAFLAGGDFGAMQGFGLIGMALFIGGAVVGFQALGRAQRGAEGMGLAAAALAILVGPWVLAIVAVTALTAVGPLLFH
jgi:heat shock protein HtpX